MQKQNDEARESIPEVITRVPNYGGGQPESRILAGYYGFDANISFTFQAIKNLYTHYTYLCLGLFCKFFGDF